MNASPRVVLMTSEVHYLADNGESFLRAFLEAPPPSRPVAVLVVANANFATVLRGVVLWSTGTAPRIGRSLVAHGLVPQASPARRIPRRLGLPVHRTPDPNAPASLAWVRALEADIGFHWRTRTILSPALLGATRKGWVNIHHGILPWFRGTHCDLRQMMEGLPGGFTLHTMEAEVDRGQILDRVEVATADQCGHDYPGYLMRSQRAEIGCAGRFLSILGSTGELPAPPPLDPPLFAGRPSRWHRTPDLRELRLWRQDGWSL